MTALKRSRDMGPWHQSQAHTHTCTWRCSTTALPPCELKATDQDQCAKAPEWFTTSCLGVSIKHESIRHLPLNEHQFFFRKEGHEIIDGTDLVVRVTARAALLAGSLISYFPSLLNKGAIDGTLGFAVHPINTMTRGHWNTGASCGGNRSCCEHGHGLAEAPLAPLARGVEGGGHCQWNQLLLNLKCHPPWKLKWLPVWHLDYPFSVPVS